MNDGRHTEYDICIVGGGVSGLAAAWYAQRFAAEAEAPCRVCVLEASGRWGGKLLTDEIEADGAGRFIVEGGPDSFLAQKPWAGELAREIGLGDALLGTNDTGRSVFIWVNGRPVPLPQGLLLIAPSRLLPFMSSPLFSIPGRLRAGLDLILPRRTDERDESVADFVGRRMGSEAVDRLAEPLLAGIYSAEPERMSLLATFPRFRALEQKHGSLIRAMVRMRIEIARRRAANPGRKPPATFVSFTEGVAALPRRLVERVGADGALHTRVEAIAPTESGWRLRLSDGRTVTCKAVVLAVMADAAAELLRPLSTKAAAALERIRFVSSANVSMAWPVSALRKPPEGFGILFPRTAGSRINAVTYSSNKFCGRAPEGWVLLRTFLGGSRNPEVFEEDDAALERFSIEEARKLLGTDQPPLFTKLHRWAHSNPQYDVGHLDVMAEAQAGLPEGLWLAGGSYGGIGVPDCVRQGKEAAQQAVARALGRPIAVDAAERRSPVGSA